MNKKTISYPMQFLWIHRIFTQGKVKKDTIGDIE